MSQKKKQLLSYQEQKNNNSDHNFLACMSYNEKYNTVVAKCSFCQKQIAEGINIIVHKPICPGPTENISKQYPYFCSEECSEKYMNNRKNETLHHK